MRHPIFGSAHPDMVVLLPDIVTPSSRISPKRQDRTNREAPQYWTGFLLNERLNATNLLRVSIPHSNERVKFDVEECLWAFKRFALGHPRRFGELRSFSMPSPSRSLSSLQSGSGPCSVSELEFVTPKCFVKSGAFRRMLSRSSVLLSRRDGGYRLAAAGRFYGTLRTRIPVVVFKVVKAAPSHQQTETADFSTRAPRTGPENWAGPTSFHHFTVQYGLLLVTGRKSDRGN